MRALTMVLLAVLLSGCLASTGVLPAGPDTYTVTKKVGLLYGGATAAQTQALSEANTYCGQQQRQFVPIDMRPILDNPYGATTYSVVFACARPDDPRLAKFKLERAPDFTVETRAR